MIPLIVLQLGGCSWGVPSAPNPRAERAVATAESMVGAPYRYGGNTPKGFDCSGLVYYSYSKAGVRVPRASRDQYAKSSKIDLEDAQPGDLLFFASGSRVDHVAIYLGRGRFVHAPATGRNVAYGSMRDDWYRENFVRAGRPRY
ncbi:MAG: C40 family peptidase [Gammaproteobacteria bacterium]